MWPETTKATLPGNSPPGAAFNDVCRVWLIVVLSFIASQNGRCVTTHPTGAFAKPATAAATRCFRVP